mgnify:CR=1 FL=1
MIIDDIFFNEFPVLTTKRLVLRKILPEDAQKIFEMRSSGRVNQFIARENMPTIEDAEALIKSTTNAYENKQGIGWAGLLRNNKAIIGTCGYNQIDYANNRAEIGGEMSPDYWGKNIAKEAFELVVMFGLENMLLHTIEAKVSPINRAAISLLESIGFKKEAHFCERIFFKGKYFDMAVYTLIKGNEHYHLI